MEIVKLESKKDNKKIYKKIYKVLLSGGIIVHPTDTCYGIAADISNRKAVETVYRFKLRPKDKPLSIIVSDRDMFQEYASWSSLIEEIQKENPDRMHSFVLKRTDKVPEYFNNGIDDIAIQMPENHFSLEMLKLIKRPLTATSANVSGMPSVYSIDELLEQIKDSEVSPDLIVDGGRLPFNPPSRIVKINDEGYTVLRH